MSAPWKPTSTPISFCKPVAPAFAALAASPSAVQHDAATLIGEGSRDGEADSTSRTGDQRDFASSDTRLIS
jgi:hypothetical protein